MKINLLLHDDNLKKGYLNIDPVPLEHCQDKVTIDNIKQLKSVCDAEAEDIVALDIIDYFPPTEVISIITHWISKLRHGGCLTVGFTDIYQLVKAIANRVYNLEEANVHLHGDHSSAYKVRKCTLTMDLIVKICESNGLKIINKTLTNNKAIVKAVRP